MDQQGPTLVAGYFGGWVDDAVMRFTEFFQTVPSFIFAILLVAIFTPMIAAQIGDRIAVTQRGAIVEQGPTAKVFGNPQHAYTRQLPDSIPGRSWTPPVIAA